MASEVDICNLALAHLGDPATVASISPPEGSAQASSCQRFYPIARDAVIARHPWGFCTRRATLALDSEDPPDSWTYRYAVPNSYVQIFAVYEPETTDDKYEMPFILEGNSTGAITILTNVEDAIVRYAVKVTDTTKFPPLFVDALSYLLASYLALPVTRNVKFKASMYSAFSTQLAIAAGMDSKTEAANVRDHVENHQPPWISNR